MARLSDAPLCRLRGWSVRPCSEPRPSVHWLESVARYHGCSRSGDPPQFGSVSRASRLRASVGDLYAAASEEPFVTSIFNPYATAVQDAEEWSKRRRRFRLDLRALTTRRVKQLEREELALEMFSEGASNGQVAAAWTTSGYYPLPAAAGSPPVAETPSLESARRVVARLKSDLRRSGQLPPDIAPARKAGRPRKGEQG